MSAVFAMALLLFTDSAVAAPVIGNVDLQGVFEDGENAAPALSGGVGVFATPWMIADVQAHVSPLGFGTDLMAGLRAFPLGRPNGAGLGVALHGGVAARDRVSPVLAGALFADLPGERFPRWRAQLQYLSFGQQEFQGRVSVGLLWGPKPAESEVVVAPEPEPPVEVPVVVPVVESERVFVTYPVCEWTPSDQLPETIDQLGDIPVMVERPEYFPAQLAEVVQDDFVYTRAKVQGSLVVAAYGADEVLVDGVLLDLDTDGVAVVTLDERPVDLVVTGGGRSQALTLGIVDGYGVWFSASAPEDQRVLFGVNSSRLNATATKQLAAWVENAANWQFEIRGSFSGEGDPVANRRLAEGRAAAVREGLIAAGIDPDRLRMAPPAEAPVGLDPEQQRNATIHPVDDGGTP